jgi:RNA-directed DNA polymerase
MTKPYPIPKAWVREACQSVKANGGSAGIDRETLEPFERRLGGNLYKLWNRLCSGSYFPPPVKAVPIPEKSGGVRVLGVPAVADRVAQTVVKRVLEPLLEPVFHPDSHGYRPGRSAHDALAVARRAVRKHCQIPWVVLYVERWLKAPLEAAAGQRIERTKGAPQGGAVSPLLANLFLHYAAGRWVGEHLRSVRFCRYADDGLIHCTSLAQAEFALHGVGERFRQCGLELHPDKTRIVCCKDINRRGDHPVTAFTFLGYTFRPRKAVDK